MRTRLPLTVAALALAMVTASAGGWAVVTVEDLPRYLIVDEGFTLRFSVRQGEILGVGVADSVGRGAHREDYATS